MKTEYKRDLNHIYLIIRGIGLDPDSYQVRMLTGNSVPSILNCRIVNVDDEYLLYFDITSKQKLTTLFEDRQLDYEELFHILSEVISVMEQMEEFLLKAEQLLLDPEYIYLDPENRKLYFCMIPGKKEGSGVRLRQMMEKLLPRIDHGNSGAVMLGYSVYRIVSSESFGVEEIKKVLYKETGEEDFYPGADAGTPKHTGTPKRTGTASASPGFLFEDGKPIAGAERLSPSNEEDPGEHPEKKLTGGISFRELLVPVISLAAAAGVLLLACGSVYGWIPGISAEQILGAGIVCLGAGLLGFRVFGEKAGSTGKRSRKKAGDSGNAKKYPDEDAMRQERTEVSLFRGYETEDEAFGETVAVFPEHTQPSVRLKCVDDGSEAPDIVPEKEITLIGKMKAACDAVLSEQSVSRIHARIRKEGNDCYLMDMNSRNGTTVNGRTLEAGEEHLLKNGDKVGFARTRYLFFQDTALHESSVPES